MTSPSGRDLLVRQARRRTSLLARLAGMAVLTALLMGVTYSQRTTVNPDHHAARILGEEMEAAYTGIVAGTTTLREVSSNTRLQADLVQRRSREPLNMLVGEAGGDCYAVYWTEGGGRSGRALADWVPCTPDVAVTSQNEHAYLRLTPLLSWHLPGISTEFDFDDLLPPPTRRPPWVIPTLLALGFIGLQTLTRASVVLLTGNSDPPTR